MSEHSEATHISETPGFGGSDLAAQLEAVRGGLESAPDEARTDVVNPENAEQDLPDPLFDEEPPQWVSNSTEMERPHPVASPRLEPRQPDETVRDHLIRIGQLQPVDEVTSQIQPEPQPVSQPEMQPELQPAPWPELQLEVQSAPQPERNLPQHSPEYLAKYADRGAQERYVVEGGRDPVMDRVLADRVGEAYGSYIHEESFSASEQLLRQVEATGFGESELQLITLTHDLPRERELNDELAQGFEARLGIVRETWGRTDKQSGRKIKTVVIKTRDPRIAIVKRVAGDGSIISERAFATREPILEERLLWKSLRPVTKVGHFLREAWKAALTLPPMAHPSLDNLPGWLAFSKRVELQVMAPARFLQETFKAISTGRGRVDALSVSKRLKSRLASSPTPELRSFILEQMRVDATLGKRLRPDKRVVMAAAAAAAEN